MFFRNRRYQGSDGGFYQLAKNSHLLAILYQFCITLQENRTISAPNVPPTGPLDHVEPEDGVGCCNGQMASYLFRWVGELDGLEEKAYKTGASKFYALRTGRRKI